MESYLKQDSERLRSIRNLEVGEVLVLPVSSFVRFIVTSDDVLHSWSVPSLGLKIDATPGRLRELRVGIDRIGVFYGICSEICGVNHAFMPIVLEVIPFCRFMR